MLFTSKAILITILFDCRNEYRELLVDEKSLVRLMKCEVLYFDDNIDSGEDVSPEVDNDVNNVPPAEPPRPQRNREAPDRLGVISRNWWDFGNGCEHQCYQCN